MPDDVMKVLHVVPDLAPESGGQSAAVIQLCEGLARLGVEVSLLATDYGFDSTRVPSAVDLYLVPCAFPRWHWAPALVRTLKSVLAQAQLVHLHGLWQHPVWATARLCRVAGVPYVLKPCGMLDRWSLSHRAWRKRMYAFLLEQWTVRGAAAVQFTSDSERNGSETFGSPAPACVVPLGLLPTAYEDLPPAGNFRCRYPALAGRPVVLFLGRLHPKKRPDLLLEAVGGLAGRCPNATLVLAGPGERRYVSRLQAQARTLGLNGQVVFAGLLRGRAVQEALVDADVFVLPSLQENFGVAVVEAMAAGCPVIVSPQVALAEEIERNGAGLVVAPQAEELRDAIQRLLGDDARRRTMGQEGRRLVLERYTSQHAARALLEVYENILKGVRTGPAWRSPEPPSWTARASAASVSR